MLNRLHYQKMIGNCELCTVRYNKLLLIFPSDTVIFVCQVYISLKKL